MLGQRLCILSKLFSPPPILHDRCTLKCEEETALEQKGDLGLIHTGKHWRELASTHGSLFGVPRTQSSGTHQLSQEPCPKAMHILVPAWARLGPLPSSHFLFPSSTGLQCPLSQITAVDCGFPGAVSPPGQAQSYPNHQGPYMTLGIH